MPSIGDVLFAGYVDGNGRVPMHALGPIREDLMANGALTPYNNRTLTRMMAQQKPVPEIIDALSLQESVTPEKKYAYVMIKLPHSLAQKVLTFPVEKQDLRPDPEDANRGDDGREHEPHITVKYGLLNNDLESVAQQLDGILPFIVYPEPVVSVFEHGHRDILIVEVDKGPVLNYSLRTAHERLNALPHEDSFPEFRPHITIAYLQSGAGEKYIGQAIELKPFEVRNLVYINPDGVRTELWV